MPQPELSITSARNPIENGTFGAIDAFVHVRVHSPGRHTRLEIPYSRENARQVDERSLRLFVWDEAARSLVLVNASGVDPKRGVVWGVIDASGLYGAIGLPRDPDLLRTVAAFSLFSAEELRASPALIPKVCGLILCAQEPGGGPIPGRDLCQLCLGLEVPIGHLPEVQLLEFTPGRVFHRPDPVPQRPPIWPQYRHDHRHTGQSTLNGPAQQPTLLWSFDQGFSTPAGSVGSGGWSGWHRLYRCGQAARPYSTVDVYALDGNSGQVKWSRRIAQPGAVASYRPQVALGPDGTLYSNGAETLALPPSSETGPSSGPFVGPAGGWAIQFRLRMVAFTPSREVRGWWRSTRMARSCGPRPLSAAILLWPGPGHRTRRPARRWHGDRHG